MDKPKESLRKTLSLQDFRLSPRWTSDLRSSAILRSVEWQFFTEASGQPIGSIFKETRVVPKRQKVIRTPRSVHSQKSADHVFEIVCWEQQAK